MPRSLRRRLCALAVAIAIGLPAMAGGQEMDVPVELQAALFVKVVAFDRNAPVSNGAVTIAIVFQSGNRESSVAASQFREALTRAQNGRRIRTTMIDLDRAKLADALALGSPFAAYIAPLRGVEVTELAAALRTAKVRSFTGVCAYVAAGLAVSVRNHSQRPRLLINLAAARAEGADYQAALLQLAEVTP